MLNGDLNMLKKTLPTETSDNKGESKRSSADMDAMKRKIDSIFTTNSEYENVETLMKVYQLSNGVILPVDFLYLVSFIKEASTLRANFLSKFNPLENQPLLPTIARIEGKSSRFLEELILKLSSDEERSPHFFEENFANLSNQIILEINKAYITHKNEPFNQFLNKTVNHPKYKKYTNQFEKIAEMSDWIVLPYLMWAISCVDPKDTQNRLGIRSEASTWQQLYIDENEFKSKYKKVSLTSPYYHNLDIGITTMAVFPRELDLKNVTMIPVWGYTGLAKNANPLNPGEKDIQQATRSLMAMVTLDTSEKVPRLIITFRGSCGGDVNLKAMYDTYEGYEADQKGKKSLNPDWATDLNFKNRGIAAAYMTCRENINKAINELLGDTPLSEFKGTIEIAGHSLGGGLASMCAYDMRGGFGDKKDVINPDLLKVKETQPLSCYSFGAPAVGNGEFAAEFDKLVTLGCPAEPSLPGCVRVYLSPDPITSELQGLKQAAVAYPLDTMIAQFDSSLIDQFLFPEEKKLHNTFLPNPVTHEPDLIRHAAHVLLWMVSGKVPSQFLSGRKSSDNNDISVLRLNPPAEFNHVFASLNTGFIEQTRNFIVRLHIFLMNKQTEFPSIHNTKMKGYMNQFFILLNEMSKLLGNEKSSAFGDKEAEIYMHLLNQLKNTFKLIHAYLWTFSHVIGVDKYSEAMYEMLGNYQSILIKEGETFQLAFRKYQETEQKELKKSEFALTRADADLSTSIQDISHGFAATLPKQLNANMKKNINFKKLIEKSSIISQQLKENNDFQFDYNHTFGVINSWLDDAIRYFKERSESKTDVTKKLFYQELVLKLQSHQDTFKNLTLKLMELKKFDDIETMILTELDKISKNCEILELKAKSNNSKKCSIFLNSYKKIVVPLAKANINIHDFEMMDDLAASVSRQSLSELTPTKSLKTITKDAKLLEKTFSQFSNKDKSHDDKLAFMLGMKKSEIAQWLGHAIACAIQISETKSGDKKLFYKIVADELSSYKLRLSEIKFDSLGNYESELLSIRNDLDKLKVKAASLKAKQCIELISSFDDILKSVLPRAQTRKSSAFTFSFDFGRNKHVEKESKKLPDKSKETSKDKNMDPQNVIKPSGNK